ncbi:MAG: hypothetical protein ACJ8BW_21570, partial [Ktedonobacteraceae bacterium]
LALLSWWRWGRVELPLPRPAPQSTIAPKAAIDHVDFFQQGKSIDQIWGGITYVFIPYFSQAYERHGDTFFSYCPALHRMLTAVAAYKLCVC